MKMGEWANSRLGESVSDLHRAKIRLGEFKAVYSIYIKQHFCWHIHTYYAFKADLSLFKPPPYLF